jgi:hypothetical protein
MNSFHFFSKPRLSNTTAYALEAIPYDVSELVVVGNLNDGRAAAEAAAARGGGGGVMAALALSVPQAAWDVRAPRARARVPAACESTASGAAAGPTRVLVLQPGLRCASPPMIGLLSSLATASAEHTPPPPGADTADVTDPQVGVGAVAGAAAVVASMPFDVVKTYMQVQWKRGARMRVRSHVRVRAHVCCMRAACVLCTVCVRACHERHSFEPSSCS